MTSITDEGAAHKYWTGIPHTVSRGLKGQRLSIYAKWLYVYLKSVAGESGTCYRSTTTLAREAGMSRGQISAAKHELVAQALITLKRGKNPKRDADHIRLKDIWRANIEEFSVHVMNTDEDEEELSSQEDSKGRVHNMNTDEHQSSQYEHKEAFDKHSSGSDEQNSLLPFNKATKRDQSSQYEHQSSQYEQKKNSLRRNRSKKGIGREEEPPTPFVADATSPRLCTPELLVELYNAQTPPTHPKVKRLSPGRRKKALIYLALFPDLDFWSLVMQEICSSIFLTQGSANRPDFRGDFDWLLTKCRDGTENCVKVAEGKYRDAPQEKLVQRFGVQGARNLSVIQKLQAEGYYDDEPRNVTP